MNRAYRPLILWLLAGLVSLSIFVAYFNATFPIASLNIDLSKEDAFRKAEVFIEERGFDVSAFDHAVCFDSDYEASVYLQKNRGIEEANALVRKGIPLWFWRVRWFRELDKEGFTVDIDPATGEVVSFYHALLEDDPGARLVEAEAKALAIQELLAHAVALDDYVLQESAVEQQKKRADYFFTWEKKDFKIVEAPLRISVHVYGETIGFYRKYLKVPEGFLRFLRKEISLGKAFIRVNSIFIFFLVISAIASLITLYRKLSFRWKFGCILGLAICLLKLGAFLNAFPLLWSFYPTTMSKATFVIASLSDSLMDAFSVGFLIFAFGSLGEALSRDFPLTKTPVWDAFQSRDINLSRIVPSFIVGYSVGFIFLGYVTLFYLVGFRFFHIWMPPQAEYSNILGTALPFLFPLTVAAVAAINEEMFFRLFAISFLKKRTTRTFLAIFIPAFLWGFAHSHYPVFPVYVRGIELTLFGLLLGTVFLRYGVEAVIIAHFVINAFLSGLPLLRSSNSYFAVSGIVVIGLAFLPLGVIVLLAKRKRSPV